MKTKQNSYLNRKGENMEPSIESIKAKCDEAVENAFTSNPLVMLEADTIYWLIEKAQEKENER
ncbi:hypothetical protein MHI59_29570 [Bacillus sp. FSL K6-2822]